MSVVPIIQYHSDNLPDALQDILDECINQEMHAKFKVGEEVQVVCDILELTRLLVDSGYSQVAAYLISKELLQITGSIIGSSKLSDANEIWSNYYTVEYSIFGVNQYYVLPEGILESRRHS